MLEGQMAVDYLLTPELPILQANSTLPRAAPLFYLLTNNPDHCYSDAQTKSQTCGCQGEGEWGKED